jgi:dGTPase
MMGEEEDKATLKLRNFMFERVYTAKTFKEEEERANRMITALYEYYQKNASELPDFYKKELDNNDINDVLCDYLSGMSDGFVTFTFKELFVPKTWKF